MIGIGLATGILTILTTSSEPPIPSLPAHTGGFLVAAALSKAASRRGPDLGIGTMLGILAVTLAIAWALFAATMWFMLAGTPFTDASRAHARRRVAAEACFPAVTPYSRCR